MQMTITKVVSKGNNKNYYGYTDDGRVVEVIKDVVGRFYRCKLIIGEWLVKQWNPLTNFILIE